MAEFSSWRLASDCTLPMLSESVPETRVSDNDNESNRVKSKRPLGIVPESCVLYTNSTVKLCEVNDGIVHVNYLK